MGKGQSLWRPFSLPIPVPAAVAQAHLAFSGPSGGLTAASPTWQADIPVGRGNRNVASGSLPFFPHTNSLGSTHGSAPALSLFSGLNFGGELYIHRPGSFFAASWCFLLIPLCGSLALGASVLLGGP